MIKIKLFFDRLNLFSILLFFVVSPIHMRLQIYAFNFWLLTHILSVIINGFAFVGIKKSLSLVWIFVLFVLYSLSLFFADDFVTSSKQMETRLPLLLVPVMFFTRINPLLKFEAILKAICVGFLLSILIILGKSTIDIFYRNELMLAYYVSFTDFLQKEIFTFSHRLFWGMYGLAAILSALILHSKANLKTKWESLIFLIYLFLVVFFLIIIESRIVWLILISIGILKVSLLQNKKQRIICLLGIVVGTLIVTYLVIPRISYLFNINELGVEQLQLSEPRIFIWPASWHCIKQSWLVGYGVGNVKEVLTQLYVERGNIFAASMGFMAHNQFLQTWLEVGVLGVVVLLMVFFSGVKQIQRRDRYLYGFYFILAASMFVESIINRFQGAVFFSIIPYILFFGKRKGTKFITFFGEKRNKIFRNTFSLFIGLTIILLLVLNLAKPNVDFRNPQTFLQKPFIEYLVRNSDSLDIKLGTKGWMYDSTYINSYKKKHEIKEFYTVIYTTKGLVSDSIHASIYCKISNGFQGVVSLYVGSVVTGYQSSTYNMGQVGDWQRLLVKKEIGNSDEKVILIIRPVNDNFKGEIYFLLPQIMEK